ncbi:MAG: hypothetical protein ABJN42_24860 [Roseibium sp.]|uniref:hypothetical protein n=1 Tax=Roseibium sp. TaxID=1936156 RepID=UPI0032986FE4
MRNLRNDTRLKNYPEIVSDLDLDAVTQTMIRRATASKGTHDIYNAFHVEGEMTRFNRPKRFEVETIQAIEDSENQKLEVFLETTDGELFPFEKCSAAARTQAVNGIVVKDDHGRGWFCMTGDQDSEVSPLEDPDCNFTGEGKLFRISLQTAPVVADFSIASGLPETLDKLPTFGGRFDLSHRHITGSTGPIDAVTAGHEHLMPGLSRLNERVDAIIERENKIRDAITPHIDTDNLEMIFQTTEFPIKGGLYPPYGAAGSREVREREFNFSFEVAKALRDAGVCEPCPNNGPHKVRGLEAWNLFLEGAFDEPIEDYSHPHYYRFQELEDAPLFRTLGTAAILASVDFERKLWESRNPGEKYNYDEEVLIEQEDYQGLLMAIQTEMVNTLTAEDGVHLISADFRSLLDEKMRFVMLDSFLTPTLATRGPDGRKEIVPLEETPAPVRHIELPLPSGRLAMADCFRIPGFNEGIDKLLDGDDYAINQAKGVDDRARAYYETIGLAFIQVGNTSPYAFTDETAPGIWRMGHVDEDHDHFYTEEGERTDAVMPREEWNTCTDRWSNVFGDAEVVKDVLMASGQYDDRDAAEAALVEYCEQWSAALVNLDVDHLHVYMPTGYCTHTEEFNEVFKAEEVERRDWQRDEYIISAEALTVSPDILEEHDWQVGEVDPQIAGRKIEDDSPEP